MQIIPNPYHSTFYGKVFQCKVLLEVSSLSRLGMIWQESLQAFLQLLTYGISPVLDLTRGSIRIRNTWLNFEQKELD